MVTELEVSPVRPETTTDKAGRNRLAALTVLAVAMSATMVWHGTGLTPVPWLTWLAPIPMFAVATRVRGRVAALAGFVAWAAGSLNIWTYYVGTLDVPVMVVIAFLSLQALVFSAVIVLYGALIRRGRPVLAVLGAAACWAGSEYLVSLFSPGGSFAALGYTQTEVLPVIQLASATGVWGVSFVLMALPALVVTTVLARPAWRRLLILGAVLAFGVAGYGLWQLRIPLQGPSTTVALVGVRQSEDSLPIASPEARQVLDAYLGLAPTLADADIMVLPEKVFKVNEAELAELGQRLTAVAAANRVTIVIGLTFKDSDGVHNIAMAYTGEQEVRYDKQHLVTGWEDHFTAGHELAFLPGSRAGLVICKDLDHPDLARAYGQQATTLLLVPALDFERDAWLHSRIAVVRGVENGVTVARAASHGRLTASDPFGRIVADTATGSGATVTTVRVQSGSDTTIYTRLGDWFAWICLVLLACAVIRLRIRRR